MTAWFARIATATASAVGHPATFCGALAIVAVWLLSGPIFGFSDTWQLIINTTTTIITNLIVFLIQNTQNRDSAATHLKLDELLRAMPQARTDLVRHHLETASGEELAAFKADLERLVSRQS